MAVACTQSTPKTPRQPSLAFNHLNGRLICGYAGPPKCAAGDDGRRGNCHRLGSVPRSAGSVSAALDRQNPMQLTRHTETNGTPLKLLKTKNPVHAHSTLQQVPLTLAGNSLKHETRASRPGRCYNEPSLGRSLEGRGVFGPYLVTHVPTFQKSSP